MMDGDRVPIQVKRHDSPNPKWKNITASAKSLVIKQLNDHGGEWTDTLGDRSYRWPNLNGASDGA